MVVDNKYISIYDELKAETVVSVLTPVLNRWAVLHKGYFYRNYHSDLISIDKQSHSLETSRNGLMRILPEGLFFDPHQLDTKDDDILKEREAKLEKERKLYEELFLPFDSEFFNLSLRLEHLINDTSTNEISDLLHVLFDVDLNKITSPYASMLAPLILAASKIRGDIALIIKLLSAITKCRVTYKTSKLTIRFVVHKEGLNKQEYFIFNEDLKPLFELVENCFIPMQFSVEYLVKDYKQQFVLSSDKPLLLNYNTNL